MDHRADDLTRLCSEMAKMREDRLTFVDKVKRNVAALLARFREENEAARRAWAAGTSMLASAGGVVFGRPDKKHNPRKTQ